jgi:hypothetical protein
MYTGVDKELMELMGSGFQVAKLTPRGRRGDS